MNKITKIVLVLFCVGLIVSGLCDIASAAEVAPTTQQ